MGKLGMAMSVKVNYSGKRSHDEAYHLEIAN